MSSPVVGCQTRMAVSPELASRLESGENARPEMRPVCPLRMGVPSKLNFFIHGGHRLKPVGRRNPGSRDRCVALSLSTNSFPVLLQRSWRRWPVGTDEDPEVGVASRPSIPTYRTGAVTACTKGIYEPRILIPKSLLQRVWILAVPASRDGARSGAAAPPSPLRGEGFGIPHPALARHLPQRS